MRNFIKKFKPKKSLMVNLSVNEKITTAENAKICFVYPFEIKKVLQLRKNDENSGENGGKMNSVNSGFF